MPQHKSRRKTKIVATIGPASEAPETLEKMIQAGMDVARINLSFGVDETQQMRVDRVREAAAKLGTTVAIMIDTKGIEIRTGKLENKTAELVCNNMFSLYCYTRTGNNQGVSVSYSNLYSEVERGDPILLDDGAIELEVISIDTEHGNEIKCKILQGGLLRERKSVNLPSTHLSISAISPENQDQLNAEMSFAAQNDVEYIAASFIQSAEDILNMRAVLESKGADIPIIAKIENRAGITNLDAIVAVADGIMVARGDLGVELPLADVPAMQKKMIHATVTSGKPVITATEMLASMENNPKPTRAEASDVANAILDGTSAVMLSGETAMGRYPVAAVKTMSTLALRAEASLKEYGFLQKIKPHSTNIVTEAVSQAAITMANHLQASAIICLTESGFTSRSVSKYRPDCPIFAITQSNIVIRRLNLNWGVIPVCFKPREGTDEEKIEYALQYALERELVKPHDLVVVTAGSKQGTGGTNMVRVITVP